MGPKSNTQQSGAANKRKAAAASASSKETAATKKPKTTSSAGATAPTSRAPSPSTGSTRNGSVSFEDVVDLDALASDSGEEAAESSDAELGSAVPLLPEILLMLHSERLQKGWTSPIYAFFKAAVTVGYSKNRRYHEFACAATGCSKVIKRYLDTSDRSSTSNLRDHAIKCFGQETVDEAKSCKNAEEARETLGEKIGRPRSGTITAMFAREGKGNLTFSHRPHTASQTRYACADKGTRD